MLRTVILLAGAMVIGGCQSSTEPRAEVSHGVLVEAAEVRGDPAAAAAKVSADVAISVVGRYRLSVVVATNAEMTNAARSRSAAFEID